MLILVEQQAEMFRQFLVEGDKLQTLITTMALTDECLIIRDVPCYLEGFLKQDWTDSTWYELFETLNKTEKNSIPNHPFNKE